MFRFLFAIFAVLAMAFAAPNPNPALVAAPLAYGHPAVAYSAGIPAYTAYGAYGAPAVVPAYGAGYGTAYLG